MLIVLRLEEVFLLCFLDCLSVYLDCRAAMLNDLTVNSLLTVFSSTTEEVCLTPAFTSTDSSSILISFDFDCCFALIIGLSKLVIYMPIPLVLKAVFNE